MILVLSGPGFTSTITRTGRDNRIPLPLIKPQKTPAVRREHRYGMKKKPDSSHFPSRRKGRASSSSICGTSYHPALPPVTLFSPLEPISIVSSYEKHPVEKGERENAVQLSVAPRRDREARPGGEAGPTRGTGSLCRFTGVKGLDYAFLSRPGSTSTSTSTVLPRGTKLGKSPGALRQEKGAGQARQDPPDKRWRMKQVFFALVGAK